MLKLAIQSRLPLIAATTTDALNLQAVILELTGFNISPFKSKLAIEAGKIYYKLVRIAYFAHGFELGKKIRPHHR